MSRPPDALYEWVALTLTATAALLGLAIVIILIAAGLEAIT